MFLHLSVCPRGCHPLQGMLSLAGGALLSSTLPWMVEYGTPPKDGTGWHPSPRMAEDSTRQTAPPGWHPSPSRSTSERYASYWNAFLFEFKNCCTICLTVYKVRQLKSMICTSSILKRAFTYQVDDQCNATCEQVIEPGLLHIRRKWIVQIASNKPCYS